MYPYDLQKNAEKPGVISFLSQIFCQKAVLIGVLGRISPFGKRPLRDPWAMTCAFTLGEISPSPPSAPPPQPEDQNSVKFLQKRPNFLLNSRPKAQSPASMLKTQPQSHPEGADDLCLARIGVLRRDFSPKEGIGAMRLELEQ